MNRVAWERWRAAEQGHGVGGPTAAPDRLPPRQDWILHALAALERGDREDLAALRSRAPTVDLEYVAELALSEPDSIDPTRFRSFLKKLGVPNAPLPRLDLLRLACAAHNGDKPTRPQGLSRAARGRPVLEAALMVLSASFRPYKIEHILLARSPRLASFWAAGIAQHLTDQGVRQYVRQHVEGVEPLSEEAWPDLDESIRARSGSRSVQTSLADFLRDPLGRPWSPACSHQVQVLASRADRAQRLHALGGLLDAIHAQVTGGTPIAAVPAVEAALELADASPEVRQRNVLLGQLHLLLLRLLWARRSLPEEFLEPLWRSLDRWPSADRAQCARRLLETVGDAPLPRRIAADVLAFALVGGADWEREVRPWLLEHGDALDPRAFQVALRDVPEITRQHALGLLHAQHHSTVEACRIAARLIENGAGEPGTQVAVTALARQAMNEPRSRQDRRLQHRARLELARAAAAAPSTPPSELLVGLLVTMGPPHAADSELLAALQPVLRARLALPVEPGFADVASRLVLMLTTGLREEAQAEFRALGRWLRTGEPAQTIPAALRLCAQLSTDDDVVIALQRDEAQSPATVTRDPRPGWLRSLTAFVDRLDTETVGRAAVELARAGSVPAPCLRRWFEVVSDLGDGDAWYELQQLCDDESVDLLEILDRMELDVP